MKKISIIIPIYNEADGILRFYSELNEITSKIHDYKWELIFIDDGSFDSSYDLLRSIADSSPNVKLLRFSRNFGKEIALSAGVQFARNSIAAICMDADLQHPPSLIPELLDKWKAGADIVVGIRVEDNDTKLRSFYSSLFHYIFEKLSDIDLPARATDFCLINNKVITTFCKLTERERLFRGIISWLGFNKSFVEFKAPARSHGESSFNFAKLYSLALSSITSFSLKPLKFIIYFGTIISILSALLGTWMLANYLFKTDFVYTPLAIFMVGNIFISGIIMMFIGILATYVAVIHTEVINRPLYVITDLVNVGENFYCQNKTLD